MPQRKADNTTKARQVGRKAAAAYRELTVKQQVWLGLVVAYCLKQDTAVFVGTPTSTGSIRLNFYPPDDKCVASINLREEWSDEIPSILSDVFGEDITEQDLLAACPWAAGRASEASGSTKPIVKASQT